MNLEFSMENFAQSEAEDSDDEEHIPSPPNFGQTELENKENDSTNEEDDEDDAKLSEMYESKKKRRKDKTDSQQQNTKNDEIEGSQKNEQNEEHQEQKSINADEIESLSKKEQEYYEAFEKGFRDLWLKEFEGKFAIAPQLILPFHHVTGSTYVNVRDPESKFYFEQFLSFSPSSL